MPHLSESTSSTMPVRHDDLWRPVTRMIQAAGVGLLGCMAWSEVSTAAEVKITSAETGMPVGTLARDSEPLPLAHPGVPLSLRSSTPTGVTTARLEGDSANPESCAKVRETTQTLPFTFGLMPPTEPSACQYRINYWADNWKWKARLPFSLAWVAEDHSMISEAGEVPRAVVMDAVTGAALGILTKDSPALALPYSGNALLLRTEAPEGITTTRLEAKTNNPERCEPLRQTSSTTPFEFSLPAPSGATTCDYRINYWKPNWDWETRMDISLSWSQGIDDEAPGTGDDDGTGDSGPDTPLPIEPGGARHDFTVGSLGATPYNIGATTRRGGHGNRIYCTISHFSWDDPIIYPGESGRAHLHMFWGNTGATAASTGDSIRFRGASSCEGGTAYRSGAWMPAVFNDRHEVVVPEQTYIYYKAFGGPDMRYDLLQVVPQGLEMLASTDTLNYSRGAIRHSWASKDGEPMLSFTMQYPSCVATENGTRTGVPILRFRDMAGDAATRVNSHVAYPGGPSRNEVDCPASHPYRFPTPSFHLFFRAAEVGDAPYLSSDGDAEPLSTLHGDYIFGVSDAVNEDILRCVIEARRCGFDGGRGQLPERFYSPGGVPLYRNSVRLYDTTDRTPFGMSLTPMNSHHSGHGH